MLWYQEIFSSLCFLWQENLSFDTFDIWVNLWSDTWNPLLFDFSGLVVWKCCLKMQVSLPNWSCKFSKTALGDSWGKVCLQILMCWKYRECNFPCGVLSFEVRLRGTKGEEALNVFIIWCLARASEVAFAVHRSQCFLCSAEREQRVWAAALSFLRICDPLSCSSCCCLMQGSHAHLCNDT